MSPKPLTAVVVLSLATCGCVELLVDQSQTGRIPVNHYVAPDGTTPPAGTGSRDQPWDLATALAGADGTIHPGDTVWLRGGVYPGKFATSISGRAGAPIVFRAVPGERAVLQDSTIGPGVDDQLIVHGSWLVFWGLELYNAHPDRGGIDLEPGNEEAAGAYRPGNVVNDGNHNRYVNLVIHDGGVAFYSYADRFDIELVGAIIYNNGWQSADRGHGHAVYVRSNTGPIVIRDNVLFNQFGGGVHAYSDPGVEGIQGILMDGNVAFDNGSIAASSAANILLGGGTGALAQRDTVRANMAYVSPALAEVPDSEIPNISVGFEAVRQHDVQVVDNYAVGGNPALDVHEWERATVRRNVTEGPALLVRLSEQPDASYAWSANTHYGDSLRAAWVFGDVALTFGGWKSLTGLGTTDSAVAELPRAARVFVRPNPYEHGRAIIVVYNWPGAGSVAVDLRTVLRRGEPYAIHNVQALFGPAISAGTYDGSLINLAMSGVEPPPPIGTAQRVAPITGPAFDVFLVTQQ